MLPWKRLIRLSPCLGTVVALLIASTADSHASLRMQNDPNVPEVVRFERATDETRVVGQITSSLCFILSLPQEWRLAASDDLKMSLSAMSAAAELETFVRSAREVKDRPEPDLASRDAAFLQRDHENLFGRPAQAVTLASLSSGATRWTATWVDANLPSASHAVTVETFIVPISKDWLLELSLSNVETRAAYETLVEKVLSGLKLGQGGECR
ncbi:hypothetical protein [Microvirga sp. 2TAF3]|uniref:hypothetical protein n=1 Tax=Microvirga sp. 2TAF3 TaxID=3233014 RepID=UPI003F9D628E